MGNKMTDTPYQRLLSAGVRIERILWLSAIGSDATADDFAEEFLFNLPEKDDAPIYQSIPLLKQIRDNSNVDFDDGDEVAEIVQRLVLSGYPGFLIQVATPVRQYYPEGEAYSWSWGYTHVEWLYAPTAGRLASTALSWAKAEGLSDKALSRAEHAAKAKKKPLSLSSDPG